MSREETTFLGRKQADIAAGRLAYHTCLVLFCGLALIGHLSCERERERERVLGVPWENVAKVGWYLQYMIGSE
jgi:hypothetical protein